MTGKIVLYGSDFCPMVPPARNLLERARADYDYISISRNRAAKEKVMAINGGNASVPTLVFPDGDTLTDPTLADLTARLEQMGHTVARSTIWQEILLTFQSPRVLNFGAIFLALGVTFETHSLTFAGSVLLATAAIGRLAFLRTPRPPDTPTL
jgi:mycoredoxin